MGHLQVSRLIPAGREAVFSHIVDLQRWPHWLGPPSFGSVQMEFFAGAPSPRPQGEFDIKLTRFGASVVARCHIDELEPPVKFSYRLLDGFFRSWSHSQILSVHDANTTLLTDLVDFRMPLGLLGSLADDLIVRSDLRRLFRDRLMRVENHFSGSRA